MQDGLAGRCQALQLRSENCIVRLRQSGHVGVGRLCNNGTANVACNHGTCDGDDDVWGGQGKVRRSGEHEFLLVVDGWTEGSGR